MTDPLLKDLLQLAKQILNRRLDVPSLLRELERDGRTTVRRLRHSIRMLDIRCAPIVPAACDTINSYGAQTFKEPTT